MRCFLIGLLSVCLLLPSSFSAPPNLLITTGASTFIFADLVATSIKDLLQLIQTKPVPVK